MKDSALSMANYFVELAQTQGKDIKPLRLMKLVYIAHGFMLAIFNKSVLNPRFDRVEAWKYGPVIPSVYHSFKIYGNNPITAKTTVFVSEYGKKDISFEYEIETPELQDEDARRICGLVFKRYESFSDWQLVEFLHKSPWKLVYKPGQNNEIPDSYTKMFFKRLVELMEKEVAYGRTGNS